MLYWTKEGGLALVTDRKKNEMSTRNGGFHLFLNRYTDQRWSYFPSEIGYAGWRMLDGKADIDAWDLGDLPASRNRVVFPKPEGLQHSLDLSRLLMVQYGEDLFI